MGGAPFELPTTAGRTERYLILRAVERVDPRTMYGRPWSSLSYGEQIELLAFDDLRTREEDRTRGR